MHTLLRAAAFAWAGISLTTTANAMASVIVVSVPDGEQQLDNSLATPTHVVTHDLSAPISANVGFVKANSNPIGTPSVSTSVTAPVEISGTQPSSEWSGVGRASLGYWIHVSGSDSSVSIPIFFRSNLSATATKSITYGSSAVASATATFFIQDYLADATGTPTGFVGQLYRADITGQLPFEPGGSLPVSGLLNVASGHDLGVVLIADAHAQDGGIASAYVDPFFYIDPAFLDSHPGYSLSFSPFVGNDPLTSGVPEPAVWAMLILGVGMVGSALRRRTAKQVRYSFG